MVCSVCGFQRITDHRLFLLQTQTHRKAIKLALRNIHNFARLVVSCIKSQLARHQLKEEKHIGFLAFPISEKWSQLTKKLKTTFERVLFSEMLRTTLTSTAFCEF